MTGYRPQFRERVGTTIAEKYLLRNLLGIGGMAAVFEAENTWTGGRVAIKLLTTDEEDGHERSTRFMQEARAATRVSHPNIVQVFDMGRDPEDGSLFIVQEFLTGQDLRSLLDERQKLSVRTAVQIMVPVMDGLRAAHEQGIVHRDIKPANIFLSRTSNGDILPKVIDFGVVKIASSEGLTKTGTTIGTPEYMSPEQAHGDKSIDKQTDVWSTAVVLWEMIAGHAPFANDNYHQLLVKIIWEDAPRLDKAVPGLPAGFADVLHRALVRDRIERYPDMPAFIEALLSCSGLANEPWMAALATAYGPRRVAPGPHDVTGFMAMPSSPDAPMAIKLPEIEDSTSPMPFAGPEAKTIELDVSDVKSPSARAPSVPPERTPTVQIAPSAEGSSNVRRAIFIALALVFAASLGAALAWRMPRGNHASPSATAPTVTALPPAVHPTLSAPTLTPAASPASPSTAPVAVPAPSPVPAPTLEPEPEPVAPTPIDAAPPAVTAPPRQRPHRGASSAARTQRSNPSPPATTPRGRVRRTRNGSPILGVP